MDMWCKVQNSVYNKGYNIEEESYLMEGFVHYTGKYIIYKRYNLLFINLQKRVIKFNRYFTHEDILVIKIDNVSRKSYKRIEGIIQFLFNEFDNIRVEIKLNCKN